MRLLRAQLSSKAQNCRATTLCLIPSVVQRSGFSRERDSRARGTDTPIFRSSARHRATEQKKREDFRRFLDAVLAELPADKEIHAIVDNYSTHKRNADWLDKYQAGQVSTKAGFSSTSPRPLPVGSIRWKSGSDS